ncbi:MAG: hypothetical protein GKC02_10525 [Methanomassiliicoccales archaeon]|nr:hypothetical protein [Methanomassiliicoccales archaeon]
MQGTGSQRRSGKEIPDIDAYPLLLTTAVIDDGRTPDRVLLPALALMECIFLPQTLISMIVVLAVIVIGPVYLLVRYAGLSWNAAALITLAAFIILTVSFIFLYKHGKKNLRKKDMERERKRIEQEKEEEAASRRWFDGGGVQEETETARDLKDPMKVDKEDVIPEDPADYYSKRWGSG